MTSPVLGSLRAADGRGIVRVESRLPAYAGEVWSALTDPRRLDWLAAFGAGLQIHVEDLAAHLAGGARCDSDARIGELVSAYEGLVVGS